jgi:intein/homing endonuclease
MASFADIEARVCAKFPATDLHAYAFGLWCADGYWWSSSIGVSGVDPEIVRKFGTFLAEIFAPDRLRLRVYEVVGEPADGSLVSLTSKISICPAFKMSRTAYHLYVNSRPLLRMFRAARANVSRLSKGLIPAYFAGRFDGDGCTGTRSVPGARIAYTTRQEAEIDTFLLRRMGIDHVSVLRYTKANEHCLYVQKQDSEMFAKLIGTHSLKGARAQK